MLPFAVHDVYDRLQDRNVPQIPSNLLQAVEPSPPTAISSSTNDNAVVASLELHSDIADIADEILDNDIDPTINALHRLAKQRCPCCLIGVHPPEQCYLRGQEFIPTALKQRIALYNKAHGSKPPSGSEIKAWNPKSIPAIHSSNKQK